MFASPKLYLSLSLTNIFTASSFFSPATLGDTVSTLTSNVVLELSALPFFSALAVILVIPSLM